MDEQRKYTEKVSQRCPKCDSVVLAIRINGFYAGSRERIHLWECPLCASIWRRVRPQLKPVLLKPDLAS